MKNITYLYRIKVAILEINNNKRWWSHVSRHALKKYLTLSMDKFKYLNMALRYGIARGELLQKRGSYRLSKDVYKNLKIS